MRSVRTVGALALALVAALTFSAACGSGGDDSNDGGKTTLTWWHNGNQDPAKSTWQQLADGYHDLHPNVSFDIQPYQNEQFQTRIPLALRSKNPPDVYQQWGGGAEATQVQSGKLMDITEAVSGWIDELGNAAKGWQVDGKQYGIPFDLHIVGFWYRKDLFAQAGITSPPTTMDDLNSAVAKLKAAGIAPIALGGKDKWPTAFYYAYFVIRECEEQTVADSIESQDFADGCFVKAGEDLESFLDTEPFQRSFLATSAQQGAGSSAGLVANGKAAMELMGDWEIPTMITLTDDKDYASKLDWFPFPQVSGGKGTPGAVVGGGDGFSCTIDATSACPDFLKYLASADVQKKLVENATASLPANPAAVPAIKDPTLKKVQAYLQEATYNQTYFDQALPTAVGQALNESVANFFAGKGSPKSIAQTVAKTR